MVKTSIDVTSSGNSSSSSDSKNSSSSSSSDGASKIYTNSNSNSDSATETSTPNNKTRTSSLNGCKNPISIINTDSKKEKKISQAVTDGTKRAISWDTSLSVMLVPSKNDYKDSGLATSLWWASLDFQSFQQAAVSEIRLLSVFEGISINDAKRKLYQPDPEPKLDLVEDEEEKLSLDADLTTSSSSSSSTIFTSESEIQSPGPRKINKPKDPNFQFDDSCYFDEPATEGLVPVARARTPSWDDYAASWQNVKMSDLRPLKYIERKSKRIKEEYGQGAHVIWVILILILVLLLVVFVVFPIIRMYRKNRFISNASPNQPLSTAAAGGGLGGVGDII